MKRLILCCDGTWNRPRGGADSTNVWKLRRALEPVGPDGRVQRAHYQQGVGTSRFHRLSGGVFGWGLGANVREAYRWLVENYEAGDEIFLFGFSRGAYTARSVAGMVRNCGILRPDATATVADAYALYRSPAKTAHPEHEHARTFRQTQSVETPIAFLGVWDSVGRLGVPCRAVPVLRGWAERKWGFHKVTLGSHVEIAVQALAIDELRGPFTPSLWSPAKEPPAEQILEQVWFAGSHSNIGGGYAECELSDLTLKWMMDRAARARFHGRPGLAFRTGSRPEHDLDGNLTDSRRGVWRALPAAVRTIGMMPNPSGAGFTDQPDPSQSIDHTVWERLARDGGYRPVNLPVRDATRIHAQPTPTSPAPALAA